MVPNPSNRTTFRLALAGALSGAVCLLLFGAPANAKATYVTFDDGVVMSVNDVDTVTGWRGDGSSFVRMADGTVTLFAVPGANFTVAGSINDGDAIAGTYYYKGSELSHGFVRAADATITTLDVRGASDTYPASINAKGEIAGSYVDASGTYHGFVRTADGRIRKFDGPDARYTYSYSINDRGAIAGVYDDSAGSHGFIRAKNGSFTKIDVPGAVNPEVLSINAKGAVTGDYLDASGARNGFVRAPDGTITSFDIPDCDIFPAGIDRKGDVAGTCEINDSKFRSRGFIRHANGKTKEFRVPENGGNHTVPVGINDSGVIAGNYRFGGFLRIP